MAGYATANYQFDYRANCEIRSLTLLTIYAVQ